MGTRSLTVIMNRDDKEIATIYRQYDGYPTGHGQDLKEILNNGRVKIVNGFGSDDKAGSHANGMGCLAAQVIAGLKDGIGNVYLVKPGTREIGEEFIYKLYVNTKGTLRLCLTSGMVTLFGLPGTPPDKMDLLYDGAFSRFSPEKVEAKMNDGS